MHYYQHSIGDYRRDTMHLTLLEHGVYRQLLDLYYLNEKPLHANAMRLICARNADEMQAFENVLNEFFTKTDDGWSHKRCEAEIKRIYDKSEKARGSAKARWNKDSDANALRTDSERNANGMLPNTQYPIPTNKTLVPLKVPHEQIVKIYSEKLPMLAQVKIWSDKRKALLKSRWNEDEKRQNLNWWNKYFAYVSKSDFLTGRSGAWQADLEWLLNSSNMIKVIEGKYENKAGQ